MSGILSWSMAVLAASLMLSTAEATAIYSYSGPNFWFIQDRDPPSGIYTTSMNVSGSFSLNEAPISQTGIDLSSLLTSYTFTDGRRILDETNSIISAFLASFDENNDITDWFIYLDKLFPALPAVGDESLRITTQSPGLEGNGLGYFDDAVIRYCVTPSGPECETTGDEALVFDDPESPVGTWTFTVVPVPPASILLGSGLALLGWMRRRTA